MCFWKGEITLLILYQNLASALWFVLFYTFIEFTLPGNPLYLPKGRPGSNSYFWLGAWRWNLVYCMVGYGIFHSALGWISNRKSGFKWDFLYPIVFAILWVTPFSEILKAKKLNLDFFVWNFENILLQILSIINTFQEKCPNLVGGHP